MFQDQTFSDACRKGHCDTYFLRSFLSKRKFAWAPWISSDFLPPVVPCYTLLIFSRNSGFYLSTPEAKLVLDQTFSSTCIFSGHFQDGCLGWSGYSLKTFPASTVCNRSILIWKGFFPSTLYPRGPIGPSQFPSRGGACDPCLRQSACGVLLVTVISWFKGRSDWIPAYFWGIF